MAPTEESILSNFLLSPAPLPTVMSLQKFTELFPKRMRSHPQIRSLYRELQQLREQDMDLVNENIDQEIRRGEDQKAELRKAAAAANNSNSGGGDAGDAGVDGSDAQREMRMDAQLLGPDPAAESAAEYHSLESLMSHMEAACDDIEREIGDVDGEAEKILSGLETTVGEMSDLRYGKYQGPTGRNADDVVDETVRGLENLEDACHRNTGS